MSKPKTAKKTTTPIKPKPAPVVKKVATPVTVSNKAIPIAAAEKIAKEFGWDTVMIIGRSVNEGSLFEHITTYGKTKQLCQQIARFADFLKFTVLGWNR